MEGGFRALEARRQTMGHLELATSFRFGGIPYEIAEASMRLFAKEVLPVIKSWQPVPMAAAAQ